MISSNQSIVIPPSPNWYLSNVLDCHQKSGVLAYAASKSLVIVWPGKQDSEPAYPSNGIIPHAHKTRVTCVSWYQPTNEFLLCSGGEDGRICIWKADSQSLLLDQPVAIEQKITSLAWSPVSDKKLIVFSTEDGNVHLLELLLNYESSHLHKLHFGKINPLTISFNPHLPWMIALGCKGGLLHICDIREHGGNLQKIRAHEEDVQAVSWCPVKGNNSLSSGLPDEIFLATSSRDKNIKIWEAFGGKCVTKSFIPGSTGVHRPRSGADDKRWTALLWLNEKIILGSGLGGELLSWEVGPKLTWKLIHKIHARGLFNISAFKTIDEKEYVWSSAQDRNVVLWPLENYQPKEILGIREMEMPYVTLPTIGGFVYTICTNPIDSSHVALGSGDGSIRLWNMAAGKPDMAMFWSGIKGKVTALAWHPTMEGRLAFGTDEGRVGVFDTLSPTKAPLLSKSYHKGTVYNLGWGPLPSEKDLFLYSCGGNHIFMHNYAALDSEAKNFNQLVKKDKPNQKLPSRTDFQWKTDNSLLAVGNEDGTVEIYSGDSFSLLTIIVAHKKLIQCLKWHPLFTFEKVEASQYANWLAIASNDSFIKVFQVNSDEDRQTVSSIVATLSGHKERVVSLAWSPHDEGKLVSASYDNTAQVWDVPKKAPIANFSEHAGRVLCCEWSAIEPESIITGGDDLSVRLWKISVQTHKTPNESLSAKNTQEKSKTLKTSSTGSSQVVTSVTALKKKPNSKLKSLFPISANLEARGRIEGLKDCKILATARGISLQNSLLESENYSRSNSEFGRDQLAHLGFFTGSEATKRMLESEIKHHEEGGNFDLAAHLRAWQGDVEGLVKEAVKQKQLSDFVVSLAPRVSKEFWMEICELYAKQLASEGDLRKAVSYFLMCGQIRQALEVLNSNQLFREATAVTRCLYEDGSPEVLKSLSRWAGKAAADGNIDLAAKCMIASGEVGDAARILARRSDPASLKLSADLANNVGLDQLASAYLKQAEELEASATQDRPGETNANSELVSNTGNFDKEEEKPSADNMERELEVKDEPSESRNLSSDVTISI